MSDSISFMALSVALIPAWSASKLKITSLESLYLNNCFNWLSLNAVPREATVLVIPAEWRAIASK